MSDNLTPNDADAGEGQPEVDLSGLLKDGKILGKYATPEEAQAGYWNSVQEMNKAKEQLGMAMQVIQAYQSGQGQPFENHSTATPSYEKELETMGIPIQSLSAFVAAKAEEIAEKKFQNYVSPMVKGADANSWMEQQYEDYKSNVSAIMQSVKTNQDLQRRFDKLVGEDPHSALELAYYNWKRTSVARTDPATTAAKRAAGGAVGGGSVGRTSGVSSGPSDRELQDAMDAYKAGDATHLFNLKFKNVPLTYTEQMEALMRGNK